MNRKQNKAGCLGSALAGLACLSGLLSSPLAQAQSPSRPVPVSWQISVSSDGQTVDSFEGTTRTGQAVTLRRCGAAGAVHECTSADDAGAVARRVVTIAPLGVDDDGHVDLQLATEERLVTTTRIQETHTVASQHGGLKASRGAAADWVVSRSAPRLVYRVNAWPADTAR